MLNVWETVGGTWLIDTKLLILFYRAMGARSEDNITDNAYLVYITAHKCPFTTKTNTGCTQGLVALRRLE